MKALLPRSRGEAVVDDRVHNPPGRGRPEPGAGRRGGERARKGRSLRVGAAASALDKTDTETHVVERRFDEMTRSSDSSLDAAVTQITDVGTKLLDEKTRALPTTFRQLKDGFGAILEETFNEDSKRTVVSTFDAVLQAAVEHLHRDVRATFDPDTRATAPPSSPSARTARCATPR